MQYKNTLEAVYIQLNEIQQNVASWGADKQVRNIDIDIALAKLRDVYDSVLLLKKELGSTPPTAKVEGPKTKSAEAVLPEIDEDNTEISEEVIKNTSEFILEELPEIKREPLLDKKDKTKEQIIEELKKKVPKANGTNESSNLSEKFGHNRPTLNEELSSQVESSDLANHLKNRPITNLSSAIGLNEKFEIINNLFNGDKEKYEETIEKLNMATNFNEAYNYLSGKLNWDMSDPSIQRILDLIRRKLIVNNKK